MRLLKGLVGMAGLVSVIVMIYGYLLLKQAEPAPVMAEVKFGSMPTETIEPTVKPISTDEPTATATPEPVYVQQYLLGNKINLSFGSTALVIRLDQGHLLPGNWAEAVSYQETDPADIFDPHHGNIYSVLGDTTVLQAHSGTVYGLPELFASNLDLYLRKGDNYLNLAEGQTKLEGLIGKTAFICQTEAGGMDKFAVYDANQPCPGKQLELKIIAASLVPSALVDDYKAHLLSLRSWLITNMPEADFASLNPKTGFLLITCIGRYPDQGWIEGLPDYDYNRLVIGFEIVP